jgi:hypothetical protein
MNERIPDSEKLREDLQQVLGEGSEPSSRVRAEVMDYAARRQRRTPAPRWRVPAAAATLVAAAALVLLVTRPQAPEPMLEARSLADAPAPALEKELVVEAPAQVGREMAMSGAADEDMAVRAPAAAAPAEKRLMRAAPVEGDLNGDGRVNIVDAWRLARSIESGQGQGDLDADGEVSPDDLDRLMQRIVAVRGGAS